MTILGWLVFPLAWRMLPALPDRGYTFSRTLGLLLWGYIFWLLTYLGLLRNDAGGILIALALLLAGGALVLYRLGSAPDEYIALLKAWLRTHRTLILITEGLFLIAFIGWAFIRSTNPEAIGTEKPMELAFINAILHSPSFPPHDPWLSGYAISYYYFGYVLVAMLAKLTGTPGGIAFNLGISLVFALSALGAYGLVYNLTAALNLNRSSSSAQSFYQRNLRSNLWPGLWGPLFVLILSNAEGFLHSLHTRGLFWQTGSNGQLFSPFWTWLDIIDLNQPPSTPYSWIPTKFWWWWRASRVIQDYDFLRNPKEIIDEFPFFSYLLADLHPHVLAMPFALLCMALALNLFLGGAAGEITALRRKVNMRPLVWGSLIAALGGFGLFWVGVRSLSPITLLIGLTGMIVGVIQIARLMPLINQYGASTLTRSDLGTMQVGMSLSISPGAFWLAALVLGGMAFLNTWDFPVYVAFFAAGYALLRVQQIGWSWQIFKEFIFLGLILGIAGGGLFILFYLSFSSQAGGILPNLIYPTRGAQLWVMFAPFFVILFIYLIIQYRAARSMASKTTLQVRSSLRQGLSIAASAFITLWLASLVFGLGIIALPEYNTLFLGSLAAPGPADAPLPSLLIEAVRRRLEYFGGWFTLLTLLTLTLGLILLLTSRLHRKTDDNVSKSKSDDSAEFSSSVTAGPNSFVLLLILFGTLLVLGPEFFFLRDQFGWRINTIFKFYYQAWLFWSIAAAVSVTIMLTAARHPLNTSRILSVAFRVLLLAVLIVGLAYPVFSLWNKTNGFQSPENWTLDGAAYFAQQSPDEMAAVAWLQKAAPGIIAEAVSPTGGSYTDFARMSKFSGQPAVLGWMGHESQWRGGGFEMGSRQSDLERLYCSKDWEETQVILKRYQIRYVYIGSLERATYTPKGTSCPSGLVEAKFKRFLLPVFEQGQAIIYEVPR